MSRARHRPAGALVAGLLLFAACASTRGGGGGLEPRFVAVHNAFAAMGLAQVGPIQQGSLAEGQAARVTLQLPAGCVTVAAVGGDGVKDVDAALLDPRGSSLAHDTTSEPQAVLRACLEAADAYVLVVKAASGAGSWVVAAWAGGVPGGAALRAGRARAQRDVRGADPALGGDGLGDDHARGARERRLVQSERLARARLPARRGAAAARDPRGGGAVRLGPLHPQGRLRRHQRGGRLQRRRPRSHALAHRARARAGDVLRLRRRLRSGVGDVQDERDAVRRARPRRDVPEGARVAERGPSRPRRPSAWPTTRRPRAGTGRRARTRPGAPRSRRGPGCGSSSTRTRWRPSCTCGARAPTSRASWRAARAAASRGTPP